MKLVKAAWLCWFIAAMLFFSGTRGAGWLVVLAICAGFVLSSLALASGLLSKRGGQLFH